jgi:hypothetical protein
LRKRIIKNIKKAASSISERQNEPLSPSSASASASIPLQPAPPPPPEEILTSNVYATVLGGVQWWLHLQKVFPKVPKRLTKKIKKIITNVDISNLVRMFGKRPSRSDLPKIEEFLGIDLYCIYGGKYAQSAICYRPQRLSTKLNLRQALSVFDNVRSHDRAIRPVVVIQSARPFFGELGTFHLIPSRATVEDFDSEWISLWRAIVVKRYGLEVGSQKYFDKISEVKEKIGLQENEKFAVTDRVFEKIRTLYGISIRLFFSNYVNDNHHSKTAFYSTIGKGSHGHLNLLVASVDEDDFARQFRNVTHESYKRFQEEPYRFPSLTCDREYLKRVKRSAENNKAKTARILRWTRKGVYHSKNDNDRKSKFHQEIEREISECSPSTNGTTICDGGIINRILRENAFLATDDDERRAICSEGSSFDDNAEYDNARWENHEILARRENQKKSNAFIDDAAAAADGSVEAVYDDFDDGDDDATVISDDGGASRRELQDQFRELEVTPLPPSLASDNLSDYSETYRPILNVISATLNIFDRDTRFKVLEGDAVKTLPRCNNKNCLFTTDDKRVMEKHIAWCRGETKFVFKQSVQDADVDVHVKELFDEGFLPCVNYFQDFFTTFDIECLMSSGPFSAGEKLHNLVTIAAYSSEQQKEIFQRKDMRYESGILVVARFIKHLLELRQRLVDNCPQEIVNGIGHYTNLLCDKELAKSQSIDQRARMRKKLSYLKDFLKLKIYGWFSETYDMAVLFPFVVVILYEYCGRDCKQLNLIKRGSGYMLIECMGLSFRDFKNYTAPMTLEKLAESCGLDKDAYCKGKFPYEWFTTPDQLLNASQLSAYPAFHSSMTIKTEKYAQEMNSIIKEKKLESVADIAEFLNLESLVEDPVVAEACQDATSASSVYMSAETPQEYFAQHIAYLESIFNFDELQGCLQCDFEDQRTQDYFRFSPVKYVECESLWKCLETEFGRTPTMMEFLYEYNFNDVKLLEGSIRRYAENYKENHNVGIHSEISIAKLAQKLAFISYDKDFPPIYSIPPTHAMFYKKCREKLSGGICQALHRAVNLNGPSDVIPKAAWQAPNGKPFKCCSMLDFNSLYPYAFMGDMPGGPGIFFHRKQLKYHNARIATNAQTGETESRFFSEGMFAQRENTSLESIRWLEYMNWNERDFPQYFGGKIKHSYNLVEKKLCGISVDGYCELENKKIVFEFRGCTYHTCPYCKRRPFRGQRVKKDGEMQTITPEELKKRDDERICAVVEALREIDNIRTVEPYFDIDAAKLISNDGRYEIVIEYACRWLKTWRKLVLDGHPPQSKSYPLLYESSYSSFTGQVEGTEGVTDEQFRQLVARDGFFGFALVDLRSPPSVVESHKFIPPIFDKVRLELEDVQGHLKEMLNLKQLSSLFPKEENAFVYNTDGYMITSAMLKYYHDKGITFHVHYFAMYYRGKPFQKFVKKMVKERVNAKDSTSSTVCKLIMNSCVGRFALAKHRFTDTQIYGIRRMYKALRNPLLRGTKSLRAQDVTMDPLHEVEMRKRSVVEDLAIHVQIQVYQNSKLLFFEFLDVLKKFCQEGSVVFTYCDTDSFLLAMTETELIDCVKPELKQQWIDDILPKWFATSAPASQKEPGLLKEEARITRGWWLSISPKCYVMADMESNELERRIVDPANGEHCFDILQEAFKDNLPPVLIAKKSAKGCKRSIPLR